MGRVPDHTGSITVNNQPISRQHRRSIGYALQDDIFFPNLTLRQTLKVWLRCACVGVRVCVCVCVRSIQMQFQAKKNTKRNVNWAEHGELKGLKYGAVFYANRKPNLFVYLLLQFTLAVKITIPADV